jgi:catecholate siderophore receptor
MPPKNSSPSRSALKLTALIMAHGLDSGVQAQTTNPPPATPRSSTNAPAQLPDVVVKGQAESAYKPEHLSSPKYTEPLRDVPQTITVVPKAVIEQQGAVTLRDVLRNVPGISFQAGEGGVPAGDNMTIRGFPGRSDIFVDGIRDFGGYSRDSFNVEQVEVAKGPASSYSGRGSVGGSVNLSSKSPTLLPAYGGSFGLGTDEYYRGTVDFNQPIADSPIQGTSLRLNSLWHTDHTPGRDQVKNQRWGIAPTLALGLGTPTRVTLSYFQLEQHNLPDYGIPWVPSGADTNGLPVANINPALNRYANKIPPVDFSSFYGLTTRDFEKTRTYLPTGKVEHDFNDQLSLRNLSRYGQTDRDSVITAPRFRDVDPDPDGTLFGTTINRQIQSRDQRDTIIANQTDFTSAFDTFKVEHALVTGLEFTREESDNYQRTGPNSTTDLFNPNPDDPYPARVRRTGAFSETTADSMGVSLFDTIKFSEQWQVLAGLRWDYFDTTFQGHNTAGVRTNDLSRLDKEWSWRAGLVYKPKPNGSIYFGYGTSFNPAAEGLSLSSGASAVNNLNTPPEEIRSFELGTKWDLFRNRANVSLAVYQTDKFNARTEDAVLANDPIVLDGEQRVRGVEIGFAGNITDEWMVSGGYAFQDSEIVKTRTAADQGNDLPNVPEHTFSVWTTYALPWNLEIGGGARYTGSRFSANNNLREAPGYWLGDAMLAYHPSKNLTLRLNVYNLTNEEYIDRVGGGHIVPGPARSAVLTASLAF